jgi:DNA-binding MarR family transcriptional regulator
VEDALVRIGRSISDGRDGIAAREGTSPLGAELLLAAREPRPQGELAEALGITEPRLSILASKLVDRKLLRRRTTKGDKRFRILELTAGGRAAANRIEAARAELAPLGALSDTQLRQLAKTLTLLEG